MSKGYMEIVLSSTDRGFSYGKFTDIYGSDCSIQESSLADQDALWLGVDKDFNEDTIGSGHRMHLNRDQVKSLLPFLKHFARTGRLPDSEPDY